MHRERTLRRIRINYWLEFQSKNSRGGTREFEIQNSEQKRPLNLKK